ncbi:alpha/beta hydrolase [Rhodococcus sp. HNM0569]|uniref:alpha/beta fold hydrolase n=1 Tax=Rhodococcus sp. HNM0569 TaxID=2716340 RepID=UPI00146EA873|nr:alpha/beta hydrolase [Rhodococcus sp. HNM0569]NLU84083.1 alpha/beta hydrolase [Rhodococcus sp. HNM0569]
MALRETTASDGTGLAYTVTGAAAARPLVLLHGWAQSLRCWDGVVAQLASRYRVIAVDLRGHGYSGAPDTGYDDPEVWAGDLNAVLDAESVTSDAVLVGWSYGGLVVADYLSVYGTERIGGIGLVGAITSIGRGQEGGRVGSAMRAAIPGAMSEKPGEAITALSAFGTALTGPPAGKGAQSQALFGASLSTPPRVRAALFAREAGHDDVLRALDVPVLVVHGTADTVVDVRAGEHVGALAPRSTVSLWEGAEHAPFVEDPERFVRELNEWADTLPTAERAVASSHE